MFKIGDFSKLCQVPVSALRYYADIDLLTPVHIDADTGYRYFSLDQLPRLNRILALKDLGLSLTTITQVLNDDLDPLELQGMLRLKEAELEQDLAEVQARLNRVKARLNQITKEGQPPEQEIVLKTVAAQSILSIREVIPTGQYVEDLFRETAEVVMGNGVDLAGAPMTIFHDSEFKDTDLDVEIAYPVQPSVKDGYSLANQRQLAIRELDVLPQAVSTLHIGSYDNFLQTYTILGQWIEHNGYRIVGQPREIYLRPPGHDEPPLTEIQYPVSNNPHNG